MILKYFLCLTLSFICYFHITSAYDFVCDFNEEKSLAFPSKQKENLSKTCKLEPTILDKVTIKCGSSSLKYKLNPPNCLQEVYNSNTLANKVKIHELLDGAAAITIRKDPNTDVNDVSMRIPPNIFSDKVIYCSCEHEKTIKVRKSGVETQKNIKYTGIVEIVIPVIKQKIPGCDFTNESSNIFTNGFDPTVDLKEEDQKITCKVPLKENMIVGFKCPGDSVIYPEDCFVHGLNSDGKIEKISNTLNLSELVMDHYNGIFYSRFKDGSNNANFFCMCSYNNKRFVAYFYNGEMAKNIKMTIPILSKTSSSNFAKMSLFIALLNLIFFFSNLLF